MGNLTSLLCCFNKFKAFTIDFIIISLLLVGEALIIWGNFSVPWLIIDCPSNHILFKSTIYFFLIIFIIILLFVILRLYNVINNKFNVPCMLLSLFSVFSTIFEILTNLTNFILIIKEMYFYQKYESKSKNIPLLSNMNWINTFIMFILLESIFIFLFLLLLSESIRIYSKINGAYNDYCRAIEEVNQESLQGLKVGKIKIRRGIKKKSKEKENQNNKIIKEKKKNVQPNENQQNLAISHMGLNENEIEVKNNIQNNINEIPSNKNEKFNKDNNIIQD